MGLHDKTSREESTIETAINDSINQEIYAPLAFSMPLDDPLAERNFRFLALVAFGAGIEQAGKLVSPRLGRTSAYAMASKNKPTIEAFRNRADAVAKSLNSKSILMLNVILARKISAMLHNDDMKASEISSLAKTAEHLFKTSLLLSQNDHTSRLPSQNQKQIEQIQSAQNKLADFQKSKSTPELQQPTE